jgi:GNAT superfamily N-acetyltransferase
MITEQRRDQTAGTTRAAVTVTFLRMDRAPTEPPRPLPGGTALVHVAKPTVPFYRYLYGTVGGPYLWWLRRAATDEALAAVLGNPSVAVVVLYQGGEPAGFFELETRPGPVVNLAYFGLMPHATGQGLGTAFLRAAVDAAWACGARAVTVNTCTADHARALPGYLRAGFQPVRTVRELWDIPDRLGLVVPPHLRA